MNLRRLLTATVLLSVLGVSAGYAQGVEGTRTVTASIGTGVNLSGNAINEAAGTIDGRPSVFVEQGLANHFSNALKLRFTGSQGLDYNKEVFAAFAWGKYNGTERLVGSIAGYPLHARFTSADAFDFEGGLRYYLRPEGPSRTYVGPVAGIRYLKATQVTFRVPDLGFTLADQPYFKGSALFLIGADAGYSYDLSDKTAVGLELGLRYQTKPGAEKVFADPKLDVVNDTGSRWAIPISGFLMVRF